MMEEEREDVEERDRQTNENKDYHKYSSKHHYSRDRLLELKKTPAAKARPVGLSKEFYTSEGIWDPEKWFKAFNASRETSPLTVGDGRERRRPSDLDRDLLFKRRPSDPKERLREEREGIVLSPQRRSFGTGCHVTMSNIGRQLSCPADFKESNQRERDRSRRIGSGRIQLDKDHGRDRFDREERFDRGFRRDFEERRDYRDKRFVTRRRDLPRHEEEEPPEWFTDGPASQADTIELRGFEKEGEHEEEMEEIAEDKEKVCVEEPESTNISVAQRNGSLETNESSSPEASQPSDNETHPTTSTTPPPSSSSSLFNFDEFFRINIPCLMEAASEEQSKGLPNQSSRFSRWFSQPGEGIHGNSRTDSRRSSVNDDLGFIHELIGGTKSPVIPSPSTSPLHDLLDANLFSSVGSSASVDKISLLDNCNHQRTSSSVLSSLFANNCSVSEKEGSGISQSPSISAHDAEAQLKALLFGKRGSEANTESPTQGAGGAYNMPINHVKTVAEVEADMHHVSKNRRIIPTPPMEQHAPHSGDMSAFNKLLCMMKEGAAAAVADASKGQMQQADRVPSPTSSITGAFTANQNEFLSALIRNKEQQLQIQQNTLNQIRRQQYKQQQHHHMMQQQPSPPSQFPPTHASSDAILNFIKQNPDITKPASPGPQLAAVFQQSAQRSASPTPQMIQQTLLTQQQSQHQVPTPRIPSPIMFSEQPPVHLSAPAPVHPGPLVNSTHTTTATIRPPVIPRVPSPQELAARTHAIMQNAIMKKQLEDKERMLRKQHQERAKSPSFLALQNRCSSTPVSPHTKPAVSVAFTPTSVIRKMHSEKAVEKEKQAKQEDSPVSINVEGSPVHHRTFLKPQFFGTAAGGRDRGDENSDDAGDRRMEDQSTSSDGSDTISHHSSLSSVISNQAQDMEQVLSSMDSVMSSGLMKQSGQDAAAALASQLFHQEQNSNSSQQSAQPMSPKQFGSSQGDKSKTVRAVIGQGTMQTNIPIQVQGMPVSSALPSLQSQSGRPIVKGSTQTLSQSRPVTSIQQPCIIPGKVEQLQRSVSYAGGSNLDVVKMLEQKIQQRQLNQAMSRSISVNSAPPYGIPITGRMPVQSGAIPPSIGMHPAAAAANVLLMQQMLQSGIPATPRVNSLNQLNSISQLNQLNPWAAIQSQQRSIDPRFPGLRGVYSGMVPSMLGPRTSLSTSLGVSPNPAAATTGTSRAVSPQVASSMQKTGCQASPNVSKQAVSSAALGAGNNLSKGSDGNLLKWFGSEVLRTQLPNMPLPPQGQKVVTVDELERCQQAVSN